MMFMMLTILFVSPTGFVLAQRCTNTHSQNNHKLQGHMMKSLSKSESFKCVDECEQHGKCHSINFDQNKGICELNDANHLSNPESLVYSQGSQYLNYFLRPVSTCSNKLCSDPLMCEMLKGGVDYVCRELEVLNFPRKSTTDMVVLENAFESLTALTVSFWVQADPSTNNHAVFGYATTSSDNQILYHAYTGASNTLVWLGQTSYPINPANSVVDGKWHHVCLTWENVQGKLRVYVDGVLVKSVDSAKIGHVISKGAIVLGQEQDSYIGGFSTSQSLKGNLTGVNMWNKVLTAQEISVLANSCLAGEGNTVKWSDLKGKGQGAATLIPSSTRCN